MNRPVATTEGPQGEEGMRRAARLLAREKCVPDGHAFVWNGMPGTAYLYEVVMRHVQNGQLELQRSSTLVGKQAYTAGISAAKSFATALDVLPLWTFRPHVLRDATEHDIYGHYCLARATAYNAVGRADLKCTPPATIAAASNAAHLYAVAAHLIDGDTSAMVDAAQCSAARSLKMHGKTFLEAWDEDKDELGAAKALACYTEAHERYKHAGQAGCPAKVAYAYERNQVHWTEPVLPAWQTLVRARITPLS